MKACRIHRAGGSEVLVIEDVASPGVLSGTVLVRVKAAGVNYIDTYHRSGLYPVSFPYTLGQEGAGEILAVGPEVSGFKEGERVAFVLNPGTYAEECIVEAKNLVSLPEYISFEEGAALLLQGLTAHYLSHDTFPLKQGDTCLIHAGAGGVGLLLIQLAKLRGATVYATVSSAEKGDLAGGAGADEVIRYTEIDFTQRVKELTRRCGVDVVYDSVGRATFLGSLESLKPRGTLVSFGQSSGAVGTIDPLVLGKASLYLTRPKLGDYIAGAELGRRAAELFQLLAQRKLQLRIGTRLPLLEAKQAHDLLEGRRTTGKVILVP